MKIAVTKDFLSGILFMFIGLGTMIVASNYKIGNAMRIGPGTFPIMLGIAVALIGLAITVRAIRNPEASEKIASWELQPLLFIVLSIIAFSLTIGTLGLIPAVVAVVVVSHFASREAGFLELICMAVVLCAISAGIFIYGLNLPIPLGFW
jgi:Tripartite tricarboxylate transporter TctB family